MASLKHVHSYIRYKKKYYRCNDPECTGFWDRDLLQGKKCRCACGTEFILTRDDLRRAQPKCLNCAETKKAKAFQAGKSLAELLFAKQEGEQTQ